MATNAQIAANRLNAQHSTGPRSAEGKAASAFNAMKHGLDAASVVIPGENPEGLAALAAEYHAEFEPRSAAERDLVAVLVQSEWQKRRYSRIEAALLTHLLAARPDDPNALGALYAEASSSSPIHKVAARIDAATRNWFRAYKELLALQAVYSSIPDVPAEAATTERTQFPAPAAAPKAPNPAAKSVPPPQPPPKPAYFIG